MYNSKNIVSIIPVAPNEPLNVIKPSMDCMKKLSSPEGFNLEVYYVIDTEDKPNDERIKFLQENKLENFNLLVREPGEGKRAGAINDALAGLNKPRYIALFDIDSRPEPEFLEKAIKSFDKDTYLVSSKRKILNEDNNLMTRIVGIEFRLYAKMQEFYDRISGFNHFNGLIGLLDWGYLIKNKLNLETITEDVDFSERAYLDGMKAKFVKGTWVGEQAVTNLSDLYSQKVRWISGDLEGIKKRFFDFLGGDLSLKIKLTWFLTTFSPFIASLLFPFAFPLIFQTYGTKEEIKHLPAVILGSMFFSWFFFFCSLVALVKKLLGAKITWEEPEREEI